MWDGVDADGPRRNSDGFAGERWMAVMVMAYSAKAELPIEQTPLTSAIIPFPGTGAPIGRPSNHVAH